LFAGFAWQVDIENAVVDLDIAKVLVVFLMPSSLQARKMRKAISPRLAIRTFSNIAGSPRVKRL